MTINSQTPEQRKEAGRASAKAWMAGQRAKYRRELMKEIMDAHRAGNIESLDALVLSFAEEILGG